VETSKAQTKSLPSTNIPVPSLYPVYLPLPSQHRILVKIQAILEDACYTFGERKVPEIMEKEGWDSPECVELNIWTQIFRSNEEKFDTHKIQELGKPFGQILDSMAQLRHTAVHRLRVSANRVEQFLIEGEQLANLIGDEKCGRRLLHFRRESNLAIDELRRNKDLLELRHKEKLTYIASQRAELDRLEQTAIGELLRDDKEYQIIAGSNLELAISEPSTALHSVTASEHDTCSETEADADSDDFGGPSGSPSIVAI
jgi:hypothetical protein